MTTTVTLTGTTSIRWRWAASPRRRGWATVVLTHLIPPPTDAAEEAAFADDVRRGAYIGPLTMGRDLVTVPIG